MTQELLDRLFPNLARTPEEYEAEYPARNLPADGFVTRFSPSPTGFLHIGGVMTALLSERLAHQSGGTFFLRIEDTDKNREQAGAIDIITNGLEYYGVHIDEGMTSSGRQGETFPAGKDSPYRLEKGSYGPYTQSARKDIYQTFVKQLVANGHAYPCFSTPEELEKNVAEQEALKLRPGYYGRWAVWRDAPEEKIKEALDASHPFAIRMRSTGSHMKKVLFHDEIKGDIHMPENDLDIVLLKSELTDKERLPTYHLAHVVDDHLMRVTHVIRGDEWFPSLPIHIELFKMFGWEPPKFCHTAPIQKMDGTSRRKLSKRKDPEANVEYFEKEGYPALSVQEFLLNLLNSNYEDWRRENHSSPNTEFKLSLDKMSVSGCLFDMTKFTDVSKETISRMTAEEVYTLALSWAEKFDTELVSLLKDREYALSIFNIERRGEKARKDFAKWSDVKNEISYFYDELFKPDLSSVQNADAKEIVAAYLETYVAEDTKDVWLEKVRNVAEKLGYARDTKTYKASPEKFKGTLGQVTNVLRILITGRTQSPDLYEVMKVLGTERVKIRLS